nr:menaquinone biosynthesis decarboxylase [Caproicibacter fermentans]
MGLDLQSFIALLREQNELMEIEVPVSPVLEMTEIADRVGKAGGPALLFRNPEGSCCPVLMNAFGSMKRMGLALGTDSLEDVAKQIEEYLDFSEYCSVAGLIRSIPRLLRLISVFPRHVRSRGICQQVVEREPDLSKLPVLKCWPQDAGRFFTLPLVFTRDRQTGRQNMGMYRMQVLDKTSTAMHWHRHKDGRLNFSGYLEAGEKMPVSVALGCDPAVTYAATAPLPKEIDEIMFAGWLRRKRIRMVRCVTNDLFVPADAEFVLEGFVDPREELVREGPFGDHTGYYSLADMYPKFHVTCVTHRRNPVYPATVVGRPPMEDCFLAKATERIFLPLLRMQIPELCDLNLPLEGVFHNCAIVSVKARFPGAAHKVMNALWGMGQMMYTKLIIAVNESVDVQNLSAVRGAVLSAVRGKEQLVFCDGPLDALDHSSAKPLYGCRLGVDATSDLPHPPAPEDSFRVLAVHKERPFQGGETLKQELKTSPERFLIAVDDTVNTRDLSEVFWKVFNNIDARRDLVLFREKIGIDATKKWREEGQTRDWPDDIVMSGEMKKRVDERWNEYGFS